MFNSSIKFKGICKWVCQTWSLVYAVTQLVTRTSVIKSFTWINHYPSKIWVCKWMQLIEIRWWLIKLWKIVMLNLTHCNWVKTWGKSASLISKLVNKGIPQVLKVVTGGRFWNKDRIIIYSPRGMSEREILNNWGRTILLQLMLMIRFRGLSIPHPRMPLMLAWSLIGQIILVMELQTSLYQPLQQFSTRTKYLWLTLMRQKSRAFKEISKRINFHRLRTSLVLWGKLMILLQNVPMEWVTQIK